MDAKEEHWRPASHRPTSRPRFRCGALEPRSLGGSASHRPATPSTTSGPRFIFSASPFVAATPSTTSRPRFRRGASEPRSLGGSASHRPAAPSTTSRPRFKTSARILDAPVAGAGPSGDGARRPAWPLARTEIPAHRRPRAGRRRPGPVGEPRRTESPLVHREARGNPGGSGARVFAAEP